jgi:hypothetical protein
MKLPHTLNQIARSITPSQERSPSPLPLPGLLGGIHVVTETVTVVEPLDHPLKAVSVHVRYCVFFPILTYFLTIF